MMAESLTIAVDRLHAASDAGEMYPFHSYQLYDHHPRPQRKRQRLQSPSWPVRTLPSSCCSSSDAAPELSPWPSACMSALLPWNSAVVLLLLLLSFPSPISAQTTECNGQTLGWCSSNETYIEIKSILSLPSGGTTAEDKLSGRIPSNAQSATIFFGKAEELMHMERLMPLSSQSVFVCRTLRQTAFSLCPCNLPLTVGESCFQSSSLQPIGREAVLVRLVPRTTAGVLDWQHAYPMASFSWTIDTLPPSTFIGQYFGASGAVLGAGPRPCYGIAENIDSSFVQFELSSNEIPTSYQCRLVPYDYTFGAFGGAPELWSINATRSWATKQLLVSEHANQHQLLALLTMVAQSTEKNASQWLTQAAVDPSLAQLALLIRTASTPFVACGSTSPTDPVAVARFHHLQLGHGLTLLQARAIDEAGNIGPAESYIWFVDANRPQAFFQKNIAPRQNSSMISAPFLVLESRDAAFTDHTGRQHDCNLYQFELKLDENVIAPFQDASEAYTKTGLYADDVNAYNITKYDYRSLALEALNPVLHGETRTFTLSVAAKDIAGNLGSPASVVVTIDRKPAEAYLSSRPATSVSPASTLSLAWFADEEGDSRNITYACSVGSSGTLLPCTVEGIIQLLLGDREHGSTDAATIQIAAADEAHLVHISSPALVFESNNLAITGRPTAEATFRIDAQPPSIQLISAAPQASTNNTAISLRFTADEIVSYSVVLKLQSATSTILQEVRHSTTVSETGAQTYVVLPDGLDAIDTLVDGDYTLTVTATDLAGNPSLPLALLWTIDTVAPVADVVPQGGWLGSSHRTAKTSLELTFFATQEPFAQFNCAIDCLPQLTAPCSRQEPCTILFQPTTSGTFGIDLNCNATTARFSPCPSKVTLQNVPEGTHTAWVRGVDAAGNEGQATSLSWIVDTTPPKATINTALGQVPPKRGRATTVTFTVDVDETLSVLECNLSNSSDSTAQNDGLTKEGASTTVDIVWTSCSSPVTYEGLSAGLYTFRVRAVDAAGNRQQRLSESGLLVDGWDEYEFVIDTTAPSATVLRSPPAVSNNLLAIVQLQFSEQLATLVCTHCYSINTTSTNGHDSTRQGTASRTCKSATTCDASSGKLVAVAAGLPGEPSLSFDADGSTPVLCQDALARGCTPDALSVPGPDNCPLGFLHECGITQLSYATRCNAFSGNQQRQCIDTNTYEHELTVEMTDLAGNTQIQRVATWFFDMYRPEVTLTVVVPKSPLLGSPVDCVMTQPFYDATATGFRTELPRLAFISSPSAINVSAMLLASEKYAPYAGSNHVTLDCVLQTPLATTMIPQCQRANHAFIIEQPLVATSGYYALKIIPVDRAGNLGDIAELSWLIVEEAPTVVVEKTRSERWVQTDTAALRVACTQPLCIIECAITGAELVDHISGDRTPVELNVSQPFCQQPPTDFLMLLGPEEQNVGEIDSNTRWRFVQAHIDELQRHIQEILQQPVTIELSKDESTLTSIAVSLTVAAWSSQQSWRTSMSRLLSADISLASAYDGSATAEVDAEGFPCRCSTCATYAVCKDEVSQADVGCPCQDGYDGSGFFHVIALHATQLPLLSVDLPDITGLLPDPHLLPRHVEYLVHLQASALDHRSSSPTPWIISQDTYGPELGFSASLTLEAGQEDGIHVSFQAFSLDRSIEDGFSHAQCKVTRMCGQHDVVCHVHEPVLVLEPCGQMRTNATAVYVVGQLGFPRPDTSGLYRLSVRGIDLAGNTGPPAIWEFDLQGRDTSNRGPVADISNVVLVGNMLFLFFEAHGVGSGFLCEVQQPQLPLIEANFSDLKPCLSPHVLRLNASEEVTDLVFWLAVAADQTAHHGSAQCFHFGAVKNSTTCRVLSISQDLTFLVDRQPTSTPAPVPTSSSSKENCTALHRAATTLLALGFALLFLLGGVLVWLIVRRQRLPEEYIPAPKLISRKAFHNPAFQDDIRHSRPASTLSSAFGSSLSIASRPSSRSSYGSSQQAFSHSPTRNDMSSTPVIEKILPKRKQALTPQPKT
eukprot:m.64215 g.64215  ORF g.64215 m.64215 type:complete len:2011 (-) comp13482_c5_seq1:154-6186(-)